MEIGRLARVAVVIAAVTTGASAASSQQHDDFGKGPAQYLMTREEQAQWKNVRTDSEAETFEKLFWARRDPTLGTAANEFHDNFDAAVRYADEHFGAGRSRGAMTDRGRMLILFGPPTRAVQQKAARPAQTRGADSNARAESASEATGATVIWIYEGEKAAQFGGPAQIAFVERLNSGDFALARGHELLAAPAGLPGEARTRFDPVTAQQRAITAAIRQPNLTEADLVVPTDRPVIAAAPVTAPAATQPTQTAMTSTASPAAEAPAFRNPAYQGAVNEYRSSRASKSEAFISWGEFLTSAGEPFVSFLLFVPTSAGLKAGQDVTFFGSVLDDGGKIIRTFEEPAKLAESKGDLYVDRSLALPAGKAHAYLGLASDGKAVAMAGADLTLAGSVDKDAAAVSGLILSNNIYALPVAQKPDDPFAFGGIKVVPKGDRRFVQSDELWYFVELRNPGLDPVSSAPRVQLRLDLTGKGRDGKPFARSALPREIDAQALKGVPGHFGIGSSLPLSGFPAGDYVLKVRLNDTVRKATYNLQENFKIVGEGKQ